MAFRWRIRHKLILGLGVVVAIVALLLAGTFKGLLSYHNTMKSISSKLDELKEAEELKAAVADLGTPNPDGGDLTADKLNQRIKLAREALDKYKAALENTLQRRRDPGKGLQESQWINALQERFDNLESTVRYASSSLFATHSQPSPSLLQTPVGYKLTSQTMNQLRDDGVPEPMLRKLETVQDRLFKSHDELSNELSTLISKKDQDHWGYLIFKHAHFLTIQDLIRELEDSSALLRDAIRAAMTKRIDESRGNFEMSLGIVLSTSFVGVLLTAGLLRFFYGWVFHPIRDLEQGAWRVAHGDFEHRINVQSGDEMQDLATAFNDMTARLRDIYRDLAHQVNERSRQLVRSERLASVGFLAAGVAHEINNPLASIAFCSEALEARLKEIAERRSRIASWQNGMNQEEWEVITKYLKMIQDEAFRCKDITQRLLEFSRSGSPSREPTDLVELTQSVLDVVQHLQNCKGKRILFEPAGRVVAWVNAQEVKSVVLNLVVNALDSMEDGGQLTIHLSQRAGMAELIFADTGCGMTSEVLENIFEPFFTRSRTGKGTGLGLTISHRIITQHGGEIEAASPGPNQGSTFTVRLPLQTAEEATAGRPLSASAGTDPNAECDRPNRESLRTIDNLLPNTQQSKLESQNSKLKTAA